MAYSVNWLTGLITIPLSDLVWSVGNTYELALSDFHKEIRRLESSFTDGLWALQILDHTSPKIISGVTYAAFDEVDPFYTIQFNGAPDAVILKGSNNNVLDVYDFNGVSVAPNNSAGLQDLSTILASAYQGEVAVNFATGQGGTSIPIGTRSRPSNNWPDTRSIADIFGINRIRCLGSATLDSAADFDGFEFISDNPIQHTTVIQPDASVFGCIFSNSTVTGVLDGDNVIRDASVFDLVAISGEMRRVSLLGEVSVESGGLLTMMDCHSGVAGGGVGQTALINMSGDGSLRNSNYTGGVELTNVTGGGDISMDVNGRVIVAASCTAGDIYIRGANCFIVDNSTGTCVVHDQTNTKFLNHTPHTVFIDTELAPEIGFGTEVEPFGVTSNAIDFAEHSGFRILGLLSDLTVDRLIKNFTVTGIGGVPNVDTNGKNLNKTTFRQVRLLGAYTGNIVVRDSELAGGTLNGFFNNCAVNGGFDVPDGGSAAVFNSNAIVRSGFDKPVFSIGGVSGTATLEIMKFAGGIKIIDCNQPTDDVKIENTGIIELDSSCTDGVITIIGNVKPIDNSGPGCTVNWYSIDPEHSNKGLTLPQYLGLK